MHPINIGQSYIILKSGSIYRHHHAGFAGVFDRRTPRLTTTAAAAAAAAASAAFAVLCLKEPRTLSRQRISPITVMAAAASSSSRQLLFYADLMSQPCRLTNCSDDSDLLFCAAKGPN